MQPPSPKQQQPQQRKKLLSDGRLHEKKNGVSETSEGLPMIYALFETKRQLECGTTRLTKGGKGRKERKEEKGKGRKERTEGERTIFII